MTDNKKFLEVTMIAKQRSIRKVIALLALLMVSGELSDDEKKKLLQVIHALRSIQSGITAEKSKLGAN